MRLGELRVNVELTLGLVIASVFSKPLIARQSPSFAMEVTIDHHAIQEPISAVAAIVVPNDGAFDLADVGHGNVEHVHMATFELVLVSLGVLQGDCARLPLGASEFDAHFGVSARVILVLSVH